MINSAGFYVNDEQVGISGGPAGVAATSNMFFDPLTTKLSLYKTSDLSGTITGGDGTASINKGGSFKVKGGDAYQTSGNGNGGDLIIGAGNPHGSGTPGNLIILNLPTSSAGLPSGAVWNNAGVLSIVP